MPEQPFDEALFASPTQVEMDAAREDEEQASRDRFSTVGQALRTIAGGQDGMTLINFMEALASGPEGESLPGRQVVWLSLVAMLRGEEEDAPARVHDDPRRTPGPNTPERRSQAGKLLDTEDGAAVLDWLRRTFYDTLPGEDDTVYAWAESRAYVHDLILAASDAAGESDE